jgi:hypothetical protein
MTLKLSSLKRLTAPLLVRHAQAVVHHDALGVGFQLVAEQRRHAELRHQRHGEFVEGVGQDDDLVVARAGRRGSPRAGHRPHLGDHLLDVRQAELVLFSAASRRYFISLS